MYTHQHCREQIPGLVKTLSMMMAKVGSDTFVAASIADGLYDIQTYAPNGRIVLLAGALDPMETWRRLNMLIDFMRQVHGMERS